MLAGQRKPGAVVVEVGGLPGVHRMTGVAAGGEAGRNVIRIACLLEVGQMATGTTGGRTRKLTPNMAGSAFHCGVFTGKRKFGLVVIKGGRLPGINCVASLASSGETRADVIG